MNLVGNERTKLTATYLNGVAIAIFAIGGFALLISLASASDSTAPSVLVWIAVGCVLASFALHLIARLFLGRLQE
jgi:hypothetical protein